MYDLIVIRRKVNMKKIIALILVMVLLIIISTISGIKFAEKNQNKKYVNELEEQRLKIEENERLIKEAKQKIIQDRIDKNSKPLTEEQMNNISNIYNSTGEKRVFLTFDDGPTKAVTPFILDILKEKNIKATFFLLGTNAQYNAELIKREFNEGHYIANHGFSHKYSEVYSSPEATLNEYNQTEQIIRDALGNQTYKSNLFRFPGGSNGGFYNKKKQESKSLLRDNGIVHLDWNALTEDSKGQHTKENLLEIVKDTIGDKESVVILMHDSHDKILTYEMLPDLIQYLIDKDYKFKNIYDLL